MLSKAICKRCHVKRGGRWADYQNDVWDAGAVWCWGKRNPRDSSDAGGVVFVTGAVPPGCPYAVEHTVSQRSVKTD